MIEDPVDGEDKGIALNRVIWELAEALGYVDEGADKICVKISDIVHQACDVINRKDEE